MFVTKYLNTEGLLMEKRIKYFTNDLIDNLVSESEFPMNSLSIQISFSYASKLININWNDILFAINNGYFNNASAIEYAVILLGKDEENEKILDLACINSQEITKEELLQEYVIELADTVSEKEKEETKDKIMYVLLNLLFDNKNTFEDPLSAIEVIYDDFNFPKSIENFVRYMQIEEENSVSIVEMYYNNWEKYLCSQKSRFSPTE